MASAEVVLAAGAGLAAGALAAVAGLEVLPEVDAASAARAAGDVASAVPEEADLVAGALAAAAGLGVLAEADAASAALGEVGLVAGVLAEASEVWAALGVASPHALNRHAAERADWAEEGSVEARPPARARADSVAGSTVVGKVGFLRLRVRAS